MGPNTQDEWKIEDWQLSNDEEWKQIYQGILINSRKKMLLLLYYIIIRLLLLYITVYPPIIDVEAYLFVLKLS